MRRADVVRGFFIEDELVIHEVLVEIDVAKVFSGLGVGAIDEAALDSDGELEKADPLARLSGAEVGAGLVALVPEELELGEDGGGKAAPPGLSDLRLLR
jgi:hypothetical protein